MTLFTGKKHWNSFVPHCNIHQHNPFHCELGHHLQFIHQYALPHGPEFYEATISDADLDQVLRERVRAWMADLDLDTGLLSSLTGQQEPSSHSQELSPSQVFNETSSPMPTPTPTGVTPVGEAPPTLDPSQVPIRSKPAKKWPLLGHANLSVFDIFFFLNNLLSGFSGNANCHIKTKQCCITFVLHHL